MKELTKKMQIQFIEMCKTGKLFRSSITGDQIWGLYLNGFENDPIFRDPNSSTHNCNLCNNFIRRYGNIIAISSDYEIMTIWDNCTDSEFIKSFDLISKYLKKSQIANVFIETYSNLSTLKYQPDLSKQNVNFRLGIDKNVKRYTKEEAEKFGVVKPNEVRTFNHLHLSIPSEFIDKTGASVESLMANYRDSANVFQRAMLEISLDSLELVRDLINQGSLLDGQTHLYKVEQFIPLKKQFDIIPNNLKNNWIWVNSYKLPFAKFKNELIGVLCSDIASGMDLNEACKTWNKRVDPANYMKATAPITKRQIEEARKFVEENGYEESFNRRFAVFDDIDVSEIRHINNISKAVKNASIFDSVKPQSIQNKQNNFDGIEEVSIEKFMKDILPGCTSVEAYLENRMSGNMVTLTTANNPNSKHIFKWSNNYSWTFNGNLAGKSMIKEAIKERGGKTEGCVNIRLHFPNTTSDYDLHVQEPKNHIFYSNRGYVQPSSGMLDLDAQGCDGHFPPEKRVENVIYTDKSRMPNGTYTIYVNNYNRRDSGYGFDLEVEIEGEVYSFNYNNNIHSGENVIVCKLHANNGVITLTPVLPVKESKHLTKEIYSLESNNFHKVNLMCLSPNYWGENNVGNKFYFFMLDGCKTNQSIRSFHNENLIPELAQHRKVLEVLGSTTMLEPADKQLSGLGFNATVKDELIVKLQGSFNRVIKIKF